MTTATANPLDPFPIRRDQDPALKQFLIYSLILHCGLIVVAIVFSFVHFGNNWGGVGGEPGGNNTKVSLVKNAGLPLPKPTNPTESTTVDPTKGLHKEEKKPVEPPTPAEKIPDFKKEVRQPPTKASKRDLVKTQPHDNDIHYGHDGSPDVSTGTTPAPANGPNDVFKGEGGGDFASRYGWYIEGVRNRIYGNWQQWTIDSPARNSRTMHCAIAFTINKDGSLTGARVAESSGNYSYDNSALRAVLSSNPVTKLPSDYSGSRVIATLDFNPPSIQ